jgi:hypothetical protein
MKAVRYSNICLHDICAHHALQEGPVLCSKGMHNSVWNRNLVPGRGSGAPRCWYEQKVHENINASTS